MKTIEATFTYWEFVNYVKNTPLRQSVQDGRYKAESQKKGRSNWFGTDSFDEALDLAINGWDAGLKQLPISDGVLTGAGTEFNPSVQGAVVNVPNYLMGLPDSMWEMTEKREYNLPEIEVYIPLTSVGGIGSDKLMERCLETINYVNELQQTHQVRIIATFHSIVTPPGKDTVKAIQNIIVKDFDERFVLNNIAYAFHPAFYRRLNFRYRECNEDIFDPYTYGRAGSREEVLQHVSNTAKRKAVIIPSVIHQPYWNEEDIIKINH